MSYFKIKIYEDVRSGSLVDQDKIMMIIDLGGGDKGGIVPGLDEEGYFCCCCCTFGKVCWEREDCWGY